MVITCGLGQCLTSVYGKNYWDSVTQYKVVESFFNSENTYIVIFNKRQELQYNTLMAHPGIKVLYQGPPAVNKNPGHGTDVRNFVVVFEYEPVQALPEVSG